MEVHYKNGDVTLEQYDSLAEAERALHERLAQEDVVRATIHKEGSVMVQNGKQYRLNALGHWVRVGKPLSKKAAKRLAREHGKRFDR